MPRLRLALRALVLALALILPQAVTARAEGVGRGALGQGTVLQGEVLRFCFEAWPPFYHVDGVTGAAVGAVIDIVTEAVRRTGARAEFHPMPYARCLAFTTAGRYHGFPANSDEDTLLQFGPSVAYWKIGMFVHRDWPGDRLVDLADFDGKVVGLQAGYSSYGERIDRHIAGGWITERATELFNLRKLGVQRIDGAIADVAYAQGVIAGERLAVKMLQPALDARAQRLMLSPRHKEVGDTLGAVLTAMKAEGWFDVPYRRHLGQGWAEHEAEARAVREGM